MTTLNGMQFRAVISLVPKFNENTIDFESTEKENRYRRRLLYIRKFLIVE